LTGFEYYYFDNPPDTILPNTKRETYGWFKRSSLFMPYKAARIFLEITDIRVERLQDISEADAIEEGIESNLYLNKNEDPILSYKIYGTKKDWDESPIVSYYSLWESINGKDSWDLNPWVFVITFKKLKT
jgi:hypothetical protein